MDVNTAKGYVGKKFTLQALPYHEYLDLELLTPEQRALEGVDPAGYNAALVDAVVRVKVKYVIDSEVTGFRYNPDNQSQFVLFFADGSTWALWELEELEFVPA